MADSSPPPNTTPEETNGTPLSRRLVVWIIGILLVCLLGLLFTYLVTRDVEEVEEAVYFIVEDEQGFEHPSMHGAPEPVLSRGELAPREVALGNIAFEILSDTSNRVLVSRPDVILGNHQPIHVDL